MTLFLSSPLHAQTQCATSAWLGGYYGPEGNCSTAYDGSANLTEAGFRNYLTFGTMTAGPGLTSLARTCANTNNYFTLNGTTAATFGTGDYMYFNLTLSANSPVFRLNQIYVTQIVGSFNLRVAVYDVAANSETIVLNNSTVNVGNGSRAEITAGTPYDLQPGKTYQIRFYGYNSSTSVAIDNPAIFAMPIATLSSNTYTICSSTTPVTTLNSLVTSPLTFTNNISLRWFKGSTYQAAGSTLSPGTYTPYYYNSASNCYYAAGPAVTVSNSPVYSAAAPILTGNQTVFQVACGANPATITLPSTATNAPTGGTLVWVSSPTSTTPISSPVSAGTYYARFRNAAGDCYSTAYTTVNVINELCVTPPSAITVYTGSSVSRDLAAAINPKGGTPSYTYTAATTGCTAPTGAVGTISNPTMAGSLVSYTAPSTPGLYYYCVTVCDAAASPLRQCKTVTVPVNVVNTPVFPCVNSAYISRFDSVNNNTRIVKLDYTPTGVTLTLIGTSPVHLNSIAYNTVDSKMYGVDTRGYLMVVNNSATNTITDVNSSPITGLPATSTNYWDYNVGGFYNGDLYVQAVNTNSTLYRINISTNTATAVTLSGTVGGGLDLGDMTYSPVLNAFVGFDNNTKKMVTINPTTGAVNYAAFVNSVIGEMGAVFSAVGADNTAYIYGLDGTTNIFYQFDLTAGPNYGRAFQVYDDTFPAITEYDGAHCPTSSLTFPVDLSVTKTAGSSTYVQGQTVTFTVTVENHHPLIAVNNVAVTDNIPVGLSNVTFYAVPTPGAITSVSTNSTSPSSGNIADKAYIPPGGKIVYHITATATSSQPITNTASIAIPSNFTDANINTNISSVTITAAVCYKPAEVSGVSYETMHGITAFKRAGAFAPNNWPMVRRGAYTALEAKTKGFVVNRLTTAQLNKIVSDGKAVEGMAAYDVTVNCFKIYDGTAFKCYTKPSCDQ
ncbi:conserved repeat domain [Chryseobacterium taklimakanense]|uniref:Conserved repeat domain n=1 Tax=Chryseobacterium taklimakanense TaxID=536441 RepID=A0A239XRI4_9FLAO|nr:DUF11 domain-containing protein [Chryseobacterium taklimakanense]SNV49000.1 conserved repeat domain [Chryseobacterium taklimakanense]